MQRNVKIGAALTGRFHVKKHNQDGEIVWDSSPSNVVLDVGWENFKEYESWGRHDGPSMRYLFLGTGTSEPSRTDTGLDSVSTSLGGKKFDSVSYLADGPIEYHECRLTFSYEPGEAEGVWTELGLGFEPEYTRPYNRSLFRDEHGDPISLTVLSNEYLTVEVYLGIHFSIEESQLTIDYNGNEHTVNISVATRSSTSSSHASEGFWRRGFTRYCGYEDEGGSSITEEPLRPGNKMTYLGDFTWETDEAIIPPGKVSSIGMFFISGPVSLSREGSKRLRATFDPPLNFPSDHQVYIGKHTIQWVRKEEP